MADSTDTTELPPPAPLPPPEEKTKKKVSSRMAPLSRRDVLTGGTIEDPVRASDGQIYDRTSILAWFDACRKAPGGKVKSPHSGKPIGQELEQDAELVQFKAQLAQERALILSGEVEVGLPAQPFQGIEMLSAVFEQLDRLGMYMK